MGKFNKGLNRDTDPLDQPEGSYRYAKNVIIQPNSGSIQFERGTGEVAQIQGYYNLHHNNIAPTNGYKVVGTLVLQDDTVVIFSVFPNTTLYTSPGASEIGTFNPITNVYTTLYNDYAQALAGERSLNFRLEYPIQAEFKIDSTSRVSVYWTDDNEAMRYIRMYNPPTTGTAFDMETLNIFPLLSKAPTPILSSIIGGNLGSGVYALAVALVNAEGTPTNYVNMSNWVKITDDSELAASIEVGALSHNNQGFIGSNNLDPHNLMAYDGCPPDTNTAKGIVWNVQNLDPRYTFIRPAVIYKIGGVTQAVQLQDLDYDTSISPDKLVSFTGSETAESMLLTDILIARESYVQAKTVAQVDDVLYWGNLVKSKIDIDYQPYANNIEIEAVFSNKNYKLKETINGVVVDMAPSAGGGTTSKFQYFHKGYQRDETYAFYISWILTDGNETVAYHIPGREPLPISNYGGNNVTETTMASAVNNAIPVTDAGTSNPSVEQFTFMPGGDIPLYKATTFGASVANSNNMGYWENSTEVYPSNSNYGVPLNAAGNPQAGKSALAGTPVRHHHFPSAITGEHGDGGGGHIWHKHGSNGRYQTPVINPLGFRAKNIPIPKALDGIVLGYKIHYANRDEANSTVLDTGIFNATPSYHGSPGAQTWGADPISGHGDSAAHPDPCLSNPKNGYEVFGHTSNCHYTNVTYAVQKPPGGNDYTATGMLSLWNSQPWMLADNNIGGHVVTTPFSAMHAPYSNVGNTGKHGSATNPFVCSTLYKSEYNLTNEPLANHFSFNGLHSHVNNPDTANAHFVKLQRHIRIGGGGGGNSVDNNQMLGSAFIRHDDQGNSIANTARHSIFFNWTLLPPVDYSDNSKLNSLYHIDRVNPGATPIVGFQRGNFRALKPDTFRKIGADSNVDVSGSSARRIVNDGGCQTFYLQTVNNLRTHDFSMWIKFYHAFQMQRHVPLTINSAPWNFNYPSFDWNQHNFMINKYDATAGNGTWAYAQAAIGNTTYNGNWGYGNDTWQDGWLGPIGGTWQYIKLQCKLWGIPMPVFGQYIGTMNNVQPGVVQYTAYGGIHRVISDLYNTFDTQQGLIYTGHTEEITSLVIPAGGLMYNPTDVIFGGDTYIGYYCETRAMKASGPNMNGLDGNGPNYCSGINVNNNNSGSSPNVTNCCNQAWGCNAGKPCDNLGFADLHGQNQGALANSSRKGHYAYGVIGDINKTTVEDVIQQLYITESKVNIVERYTGNDVNEDFFPSIDRQSQSIATYSSGPRLFTYDVTMQSLMNLYPTVPFNHLNVVSNKSDFPTRVIRSVRNNKSGLIDNFRSYLPGEYRDLPRNRGELWNLSVYENVLLPQLERALMKTKGKESLQTGAGIGDASEIALGDGNLFKSDPNEILYTERGYAGTLSQWSVCTSRYGHLSVDKKTGKIFLLSDKLEEISSYGMRKFFATRLNKWALEQYGLPYNIDLPTLHIGVIATFDPEHSRFVITKLDKNPTQYFKDGWNAAAGVTGKITWNPSVKLYQRLISSGAQVVIQFDNTTYFTDVSWTASYYPALKVWGSLHDFSPRIYFYTTNKLYSIEGWYNNGTGSYAHIYQHAYATGTTDATATHNISQYYGIDYDVVFEYVDNVSPMDNKLYSNISYTVDVESPSDLDAGARHNFQDSGFTHYGVYNSRQVSRELALVEPEGTNNNLWATASVRRKERTWSAKGFRDDRQQSTVAGSVTDGPVDSPILTMNYLTGDINFSTASLNLTLLWNQRRKMVDKWMAIRLICKSSAGSAVGAPGSAKKLVTLHHADATKRKSVR